MLQEAEKDIPYPPAEARAAPGRLAACISAVVCWVMLQRRELPWSTARKNTLPSYYESPDKKKI